MIDFNGYLFVDEYTYMIALDSMKHFTSLTIVPLKLNDDGVDINDLEVKVKDRRFKSQSKEFWAIYYTIPTYHNPTGILFSPSNYKIVKTFALITHCFIFSASCL